MSTFSFARLIRVQRKPLPPVEHVDLSGRIVVVTGANTGLGFEAAKHFARMRPAKLIIACRSKDKGEAAIKELAKETGYDGAEVMSLDAVSFASVSAFVDEFEKRHARLDILVANAGVGLWAYQPSKDGWEESMQVNHLSTALLSLLLLPLMVKTAETHGVHPHLAVVASDVHLMTTFGKDKTQLEAPILEKMSDKAYCTKSVMADRYNFTKLLNVMFVRQLAARLPSTSAIVPTSLSPGFCYSSFRRDIPFPFSLLSKIMEVFLARSTEMGSRTLVTGALMGENGDTAARENARGAYMDSCEVMPPSAWLFTKDGAAAEQATWDETLQILQKADTRVQEVVQAYLAA